MHDEQMESTFVKKRLYKRVQMTNIFESVSVIYFFLCKFSDQVTSLFSV